MIISYAGSTQQMAGGTVTISGGNVIHTFTSSGYLAPLKLVNNSLRFRSSASTYLSRTPAIASNRKTWTWSAWIKRGTLCSGYPLLFQGGTTSSDPGSTAIAFGSNDKLYVQGYSTNWIITNAVYRDPAAWYHIVVAMDSTQATATNRLKLYVNGSEVSYGTYNNLTQNTDYGINQAQNHVLGQSIAAFGGNYFDGYMTEVNFIDGQALTPNSFGTFNSYGVWQPITYGGSYGTNGFYLPFNAGTSTYVGGFNGSSQYLYLGGQSNFAFGSNSFTIEFWVNANSYSNTPLLYDGRGSGTTAGAYPTIYIDSATGSIVYFTNGAGQIISPTTISVNTWNHIAVVRSSTTTTLYLNGISQGTYSDSQSYLNGASRPLIANNGYNVSNYLNGYMSNLRVVNGTAVYTSNFIPSTTPLTAITNTQLLTLQNATIVDNSTNAFTINNVGTVVTNLNYPFSAAKIFKDQSPQGNNWTPNNVSGASGSTLDYMTDVPTLTSATVANYCVLNPLSKGANVSATNGNLNAVISGGSAESLQSTLGMASGKWYCEMTAGGGGSIFGITTVGANLSSWVGSDTKGYGYRGDTGAVMYNSSALVSGMSTFASGDVISLAFDADTGKLWFAKNGTWYNSGSPSAGTNATVSSIASGTWFVSVGRIAATNDAQFNFGQQPFAYTAPTGFLPLNTYNL